jgi:hypothetical protein
MNALTKISAIVGLSAFAGIFAWGALFQLLQRNGLIRDPARLEPFIKLGVFALFLLFALGCMPLMMRLFIAGQGSIGNEDLSMVRFLRDHFVAVTFAVWAFMLLGLVIALPVMWTDFFGFSKTKTPVGISEGLLRADVGMTLDEIQKASTLQLAPPIDVALTGSRQTVGKPVFDFEIVGSAVRFEQCRYYFIETAPKHDPHVRSMNIGASPSKTSRTETDAALALLHKKLEADGWRVGYFVYRTRESQVLHGGISTERDPRYWLKGYTLLVLSTRRMDDPKPGEDPKTAGEFIVVLEINPFDTSSHPHLQFDPPTEPVPLVP